MLKGAFVLPKEVEAWEMVPSEIARVKLDETTLVAAFPKKAIPFTVWLVDDQLKAATVTPLVNTSVSFAIVVAAPQVTGAAAAVDAPKHTNTKPAGNNQRAGEIIFLKFIFKAD